MTAGVLEPMSSLGQSTFPRMHRDGTQNFGAQGKMRTMETQASGRVRLEYDVPARGLIGFAGAFCRHLVASA